MSIIKADEVQQQGLNLEHLTDVQQQDYISDPELYEEKLEESDPKPLHFPAISLD